MLTIGCSILYYNYEIGIERFCILADYMEKESKKKLGEEALKKRPQLGKIDENYNNTPKSLLPKNKELRQIAKMTRKSLAYALEGQPVKIKMPLDILFEEDPRAYIDAIAKLMNYAIPKLSSTEIKKDTDTKIEIKLNEGATLEDIKNQIRGLDDTEDIEFTELDDQ